MSQADIALEGADAERQLQLREVLDALPAAVYLTDPEGRITYFNRAAETLAGRTPRLGRDRWCVAHKLYSKDGEPLPLSECPMAVAIRERRPVRGEEIVVERPDGARARLMPFPTPIFRGGLFIGAINLLVDVSTLHKAEAERGQSETRLRLAMEAGRLAVWENTPGSGELTASPELCRLLGVPEDRPIDLQELRARLYPGDREALIAATEASRKRGDRFVKAEFRLTGPDGELRWFMVRAESAPDPKGGAGRTIGVLLDITDQKRVEEELRAREADLNAALEAGALAIVDFDHRTGRFAPSPRVNELYGYPPDHELTIEDVRRRYYPGDAPKVSRNMQGEQSDPSVAGFGGVLRLLLPGGQVRWLEGRGEYVRDAQGRVIRSRGVLMDITERKRWEEHQRLLVNELNHRVKNTLAVVQGLARQSLRPGEGVEAARAAFESRLEALSAAHNLLTRQSWQSASVAEVVSSSVAAALGEAAERVSWEGPHIALPPQTAVSVALAVHELCTNAVKYGALSVPAGTVSVRWRAAGEDGSPRFHFEWVERNGPKVEPPARRGFGARMIERGLAAELAGTAELRFDPEGVSCVIDAPLPALSA